MSADIDRWTEIRSIHIESADAYRIMGGIVLVGLGIWIGSLIFAGDNGYGTNLYTELISIGVTVFILDFLNRRRDDRRRIEDLKARLLRDIRSSENSIAKQAAHELREYGWLEGEQGLLQRRDLRKANLQEANMMNANLRGTNLAGANLQGADLWKANLQISRLLLANLEGARLDFANLEGANLRQANLQESKLWGVNLQGADLWRANLERAYLFDANLRGANLRQANLQGMNLTLANLEVVNLEYTKFDEQTLLPDQTFWQSDVDVTRFTDSNHPEFWRSDNVSSPAYRGKEDTE